ncbi:hypothetical protein [Mesorhizobium sp. SP-1A]|uniref:hypothetical protein n=1 Tax=Mesorhizobium sp. SP-1A TaxID=3077840 RepID=UPI0028F7326D|nr:hypothetical protein [Mesorhizobium sp. SP-1A]
MNSVINRLSVFSYRNLPLIVFVILTLGGCIFIVFAKFTGMNLVVATAVPVALVFAYLALAWMFSAIRLHDEQTGDNLYYMGFLFTLASLGASLFLYTRESSIDDVVRNFGIAISSTITGIALRIFYNQTRRDVIEIERATRHDLAAVARRVRTELESSTREFASLRRANNQLINEGFEGVVKQVNKTGERISSTVTKLAESSLKPIEQVSEKFTGIVDTSLKSITSKLGDVGTKLDEVGSKIDESGNALSKTNQSMVTAAEALTRQFETIVKKLEAVSIPDGVLKDEMAPIIKDLRQTMEEQAAQNEAFAKEQSARIEALLGSINTISEAVTKNVQNSDRLIQSNETLSQQVKEQHSQIDKLIKEQSTQIDKLIREQAEARLKTETIVVPQPELTAEPRIVEANGSQPDAPQSEGESATEVKERKSWWNLR